MLIEGNTVALVSDAGTPGISDPGFLLVRECVKQNIAIECLPGPTAFVPALVLSGLPCERFVFEGFLPQKKGRHTRLEQLKTETRTMVFYESPFRLVKTLEQLSEYFGVERETSVSRELTKFFEEVRRAPLTDLAAHYAAQPDVKGEIVVVIGPPGEAEAPSADTLDQALSAALAGASVKDAASAVRHDLGLPPTP